MTFTATDRLTGETGFVRLNQDNHDLDEICSNWSIVIGPPDRPSFLDHVIIAFEGFVVPKRPRTYWPRIIE